MSSSRQHPAEGFPRSGQADPRLHAPADLVAARATLTGEHLASFVGHPPKAAKQKAAKQKAAKK